MLEMFMNNKKKSLFGSIWAVIVAGVVLLMLVQFLPDKENAQNLAHYFIAIALIVALAVGFTDFRKNKGKE